MKTLPNKAGIYIICHTPSCTYYVGQSRNIRERIDKHMQDLIAGQHHNMHLSQLWQKSDREDFDVEVYSLCPDELSPLARQRWLVKAERQALEDCKSIGSVLNIARPEIVETPDALAEFREKKEEADRALYRATSLKRKNLKAEIERLHVELIPLRQQRYTLEHEIRAREETLSRSKAWYAFIFGRPTPLSIEQQETQIAEFRIKLSALLNLLSPLEKQFSECEGRYCSLYSDFPKVRDRMIKRYTCHLMLFSRKGPTITEEDDLWLQSGLNNLDKPDAQK